MVQKWLVTSNQKEVRNAVVPDKISHPSNRMDQKTPRALGGLSEAETFCKIYKTRLHFQRDKEGLKNNIKTKTNEQTKKLCWGWGVWISPGTTQFCKDSEFLVHPNTMKKQKTKRNKNKKSLTTTVQKGSQKV